MKNVVRIQNDKKTLKNTALNPRCAELENLGDDETWWKDGFMIDIPGSALSCSFCIKIFFQ